MRYSLIVAVVVLNWDFEVFQRKFSFKLHKAAGVLVKISFSFGICS